MTEDRGGHGTAGTVAVWRFGPTSGRISGSLLPPRRVPVIRAAFRLLAHAPVEACGHLVRLGDALIHHLEAGSGPNVVLLHGGGGGGANWYRLLPSLCSAGFRVLAPDLPGFGLSDPVPPGRPLGQRAAASLDAWLDAVAPDPVVLVGTSFGALAALRLAQLRPRRIAGMALVGAVGLGRGVAWPLRVGGLRALSPLLDRPSRRGSEWMFRRLMVSDPDRVPTREREALLDYLHEVDRAGAARTVARSLHHFSGPNGQRERLGPEELRAMALPVLVIWGSEDRFVPVRHGRRAAALLPRGMLRVVAGCGHSPNWEAPDALLEALLPFLREWSATGAAPA